MVLPHPTGRRRATRVRALPRAATRRAGTRTATLRHPAAGPPAGRTETSHRPAVHRRAARTWALLRLTRPWFWPLGWAAAYAGSVLATRTWLPPTAALPRSLVALVVLGPLLWTAVLTVNDRHDLPSDRRNPRKATAPLVIGLLTEADLLRWHVGATVAALALTVTAIGPAFALGTALVLLLGWAYSTPPVRLKTRPGLDVAANALAVGVLAPLAGWSLHRPVTSYPVLVAVLGLLLVAALYLPTTVLDVDADTAAGDTTAAVRWGTRRCRRAGLALWAAATGVWLVCCHLGVLVRRDSWTLQDLWASVLIAGYAVAVRRPSIPRLAGVCLLFAVPAGDFLTWWIAAGPA
ncbi:UbiA family prenyltransferase [Micromonospora humi]|uniref:Chlorophyll synthase n=1 Tax=Micromonospora humi TaxID=745366 RepID=A0A1C5K558_9ACTN|nr:UbiA family prenyltransferase [Micromonospora humi]SCG77904.1 chlorophyll synthase [Micromonospora humi]